MPSSACKKKKKQGQRTVDRMILTHSSLHFSTYELWHVVINPGDRLRCHYGQSVVVSVVFFFFFNDTATTEIYTLSLHDALPISEESGALVKVNDSFRMKSHQ